MKRKRSAVVLDCEMVEVTGGQSEVVRLCAVDFLTVQVIVDIYVVPRQRVFAWRTRVSGVTEVLLMKMKRQGRTVDGWQQARALLWEHIDENTILLGHALNNDLNVLGMIHTRIVDSGILAKAAVGPDCDYSPGLKRLCQEFLGREIQTGAAGHSCMEDTFSTREVLLWCLRYPDRFREWAISERALMEKRRAERKAKAEEKQKEKEEKNKKKKEKKQSQTTSVGDDSVSESNDGLDDLSEGSEDVLVEEQKL